MLVEYSLITKKSLYSPINYPFMTRFLLADGRLFFAVLVLSFCCHSAAAQSDGFRIGPGLVYGDTTELHQLVLANYSRFVGTATGLRDNELYFRIRGADDTTTFLTSNIRYVGLLAGSARAAVLSPAGASFDDTVYDGRYDMTFTDPTYLRTAFLNRGKGQLRIVNAIYSVVEINATKNIQFGGGMLLPLGFLFTQRLGFRVAGPVHIGMSNQMFLPILTFGSTAPYGDVSVNLSVGSEARFLSVGRGLLYDTDFDETAESYTLSIGGALSPTVQAYSEIMLVETAFGNTNLLPSLSVAFTNRRHRWRVGLFRIIERGLDLFALPLAGYELKF